MTTRHMTNITEMFHKAGKSLKDALNQPDIGIDGVAFYVAWFMVSAPHKDGTYHGSAQTALNAIYGNYDENQLTQAQRNEVNRRLRANGFTYFFDGFPRWQPPASIHWDFDHPGESRKPEEIKMPAPTPVASSIGCVEHHLTFASQDEYQAHLGSVHVHPVATETEEVVVVATATQEKKLYGPYKCDYCPVVIARGPNARMLKAQHIQSIHRSESVEPNLRRRVMAQLSTTPRTSASIAEAIGVPLRKVTAVLRRESRNGHVIADGHPKSPGVLYSVTNGSNGGSAPVPAAPAANGLTPGSTRALVLEAVTTVPAQSYADYATLTGLTDKQVSNATSWLAAHGLVEVAGRGVHAVVNPAGSSEPTPKVAAQVPVVVQVVQQRPRKAPLARGQKVYDEAGQLLGVLDKDGQLQRVVGTVFKLEDGSILDEDD